MEQKSMSQEEEPVHQTVEKVQCEVNRRLSIETLIILLTAPDYSHSRQAARLHLADLAL